MIVLNRPLGKLAGRGRGLHDWLGDSPDMTPLRRFHLEDEKDGREEARGRRPPDQFVQVCQVECKSRLHPGDGRKAGDIGLCQRLRWRLTLKAGVGC